MAIKAYRRADAALRSERVMQEKGAMCALRLGGACPFVVELLDTSKDDEFLYFWQTAILGGSLHKHIFRQGHSLYPSTVQGLAAELVSALRHLANCAVVHRDLKLNNVLLDAAGHAVLCDFSSAKLVHHSALSGAWVLSDLPKCSTLTGSLHVMAPEMAAIVDNNDGSHSLPVDWWALGIVIYEMMTGTSFPWNHREEDESGSGGGGGGPSSRVRLAASRLLENAMEDPDMQGCWDWTGITPCAFGQACFVAKDAHLGPEARHLIQALVTAAPLQRYSRLAGAGDSPTLDNFFAGLEAHPFFQGIPWDSVHTGTGPSPWPDFDRRLGFLEIVDGADDGDNQVPTTEQQLFFDFF